MTTAYEQAKQIEHPRAIQSFLAVLAENFPRWAVNNNGNLLGTSGRLSSVSIPVRAGTPCEKLSFVSATSAYVNPTHWWFALVDAAYVPIRQSANQLAAPWTANTLKTLTLDSIPVTAGARAASATVTLTFPTLSQPLTDLMAPGDSVVVSNANIAAYNGTFTLVTVTSTQATYVSGGSATDSLAAPFPTVQLAAGKRIWTPTVDALPSAVIMCAHSGGSNPTLACYQATLSAINSLAPILVSSGNTGLTGTVPSPITTGTGSGLTPWAGIT